MSLAADYADLERIAREVAIACGRLITEERPDQLGVADTKTSDVDVVTVMDQRSEQLAAQLLREHRPDDGQYGEEGLRVDGGSGITWVVDPIDGTVNYLYGIPAYAVSVAAVVGDPATVGGWSAVAGAVYSPGTDELFCAHAGGGATRRRGDDVAHLSFSPADKLATSLVATGFGYDAERRRRQGAVVAKVLPQVRDIRRLGSAALDVCHVADGALDAYYERGVNVWDIAAGCIVAAEAGAIVHHGHDNGYGPLVCVGSRETVRQLLAHDL